MTKKTYPTVELDGADVPFALTVNKACEIETATGQKYGDLIAGFAGGVDMATLRLVFATALTTADRPVNDREAGNIIDRIGIKAAVDTLAKANAVLLG